MLIAGGNTATVPEAFKKDQSLTLIKCMTQNKTTRLAILMRCLLEGQEDPREHLGPDDPHETRARQSSLGKEHSKLLLKPGGIRQSALLS